MKKKFPSHSLGFAVISSSIALLPLSALAQDDVSAEEPVSKNSRKKTGNTVEEIVVTGTKINAMDAQEMKRGADTMLDAISADQIGLLPDRSALDAMQRLPGVAIERFAAPNDPDHYSVEGSDIILRGMSQTRSEFNGRDSFSANTGRGLSYQDIPPELLGSIQIFKNQTADMIEGGIGGTVNLVTRKPLDIDDHLVAFSVDYSYGDLAETWSPSFSGLLAKAFDGPVGRWGVLVNYANSELVGESHGIQSDAYVQFEAQELYTANNPNPVGTRAEDFFGEDGKGRVWAPNGANALMKEDRRTREGFTAALQFASDDGRFEALAEYIRSDSTLTWHEQALKYQGGYQSIGIRPTAPLAGTHFLFDENGLFLAGTIMEEGNSWRVGSSGHSRVPTSLSVLNKYKQWGHRTQMDSRINETQSLVEDFHINVKWQPHDRLNISGDLQYIDAEARVDDLSIHLMTYSIYDYDTRGSTPHLRLIEPWNGQRDRERAEGNPFWDALTNDQYNYPGFGGDPLGDQNYFQDPNSYLWRSAMDHYERSDGDSLAWRLDLDYAVGDGLLRQIKVGYRYAEREQTVRSTAWNWGALAPEWNGQSKTNFNLSDGEIIGTGIGWVSDVPPLQDGYELVNWSNFMRGGVLDIQGNQTLHATEKLIREVWGANPSRRLIQSYSGGDNWLPYPDRDQAIDLYGRHFEAAVNVPLDNQYGIFTPDEINRTLEMRNAFYLRLDFAGDGNLPFSGNVGLRYLKMERQALGIVEFPLIVPRTHELQQFPPDSLSQPLNGEMVENYLRQQVANGTYPDFYQAATAAENNWIYNPYFFLASEIRGFTQGVALIGSDGKQLIERNQLQFAPYVNEEVAKHNYDTLLPSFNIKADLTDNLVGRFAFAKAVAFPDLGDVRNRTDLAPINIDPNAGNLNITYRYADTGIPGDRPIELIDQAKLNKPADGTWFVGEGGNPYLKPMESVQYDFSLEWYFSNYGQLSGAIFHKNLSNYFSPGVITREFTNNFSGVTQPVAITTQRNGGDAKLDGIEITYNQFFSGLFEGFGFQATYTYIDATSIPNNEKRVEDEQWYNSLYEDTGIRVDPAKLPLQGQSDEIINLIGMYEDDRLSINIAYNWRSKYLLTTRDVISKAPIWYDDYGELDGSIFYKLTDNFTLGLQAKNLTNARAKTLMILNDQLLETGRSWFVSDRRVALVLHGEF
ncbi:TonB-dependent receptor [Saccharophagus sp. K07]|uniref:TonB-dependent receptor n=1 Tax=Saccharophagus sp. K07 TaxID=2283636 RepID=UPI00165285D0|nr:TonB-dependent receptor [Saccharophagus sp. K07]MBC6905183.1 TonB-dependent receptor [Saccharophagus sp. K07]